MDDGEILSGYFTVGELDHGQFINDLWWFMGNYDDLW